MILQMRPFFSPALLLAVACNAVPHASAKYYGLTSDEIAAALRRPPNESIPASGLSGVDTAGRLANAGSAG